MMEDPRKELDWRWFNSQAIDVSTPSVQAHNALNEINRMKTAIIEEDGPTIAKHLKTLEFYCQEIRTQTTIAMNTMQAMAKKIKEFDGISK